MTKLHQIVALAEGKKTNGQKILTKAYHMLQKGAGENSPFAGIERTYEKKSEEDSETFPAESKRVQFKVKDSVGEVKDCLEELWNTLLTQDVANTSAKADVTVDGKVLAKDVPVTHLMYLEKQLTDLGTFVDKLPTLDPAFDWTFDDNSDAYATKTTQTHKTKKVPRVIEKYKHTEEHPAQVELIYEDKVVGYWNTRHFNGCIPAKDKNDMLARVRRLQDAVKVARTKANDIEVEEQKQAKDLLAYVFGDVK